MEEKRSSENNVKTDTNLKENWKQWENEMGKVYLENECAHICSARDCTGLIPAGHKDDEIYKKYETLYPYRPNKKLAETDSTSER